MQCKRLQGTDINDDTLQLRQCGLCLGVMVMTSPSLLLQSKLTSLWLPLQLYTCNYEQILAICLRDIWQHALYCKCNYN